MLIRDIASRSINGLKGKADETYTRMYDWLGEKYKDETESIENMAKIIRYAIESKEKIESQLVLDRYSFFIAEVSSIVKMFVVTVIDCAGCHRCSTSVATSTASTDGTDHVRTIHHRTTEGTLQTGTEREEINAKEMS